MKPDPTDFRNTLDRLRDSYDREVAVLVAAVRSIGRDEQLEPSADALREAHVRVFLVDPMLRALNWQIGEPAGRRPPSVVPEAAVGGKGKRYFLDYLGVDRGGRVPLMIGETKRPGSAPPTLATGTATTDVPLALSQGLRGAPLQAEWSEWLGKIREYVADVRTRWNAVPRRVWITDGNWLAIFADPEDAFQSSGSPDPARIMWYGGWEEIRRSASVILGLLEYQTVLGEAPALAASAVPFYATEGDIEAVMHGLRVVYQDVRWPYGPDVSTTRVAPVLFMRTRQGGWLRVETFARARQREVPRAEEGLGQHLQEVSALAAELRRGVEDRLGRTLRTWTLHEHYGDSPAFLKLPGVQPDGQDVYLVATGDHTHFLRLSPSVPDCPWHDWNVCETNGVAEGDRPAEFAVERKRVLFPSRRQHHCAHIHVMGAKTGPVRAANRDACGARSTVDEGGPFCEIFPFERYLCCRTCAFEEVCTAAPVFRLPCVRPMGPGALATTAPPTLGRLPPRHETVPS